MGNVFTIQKSLGTPRTSFQRYHPGYFMTDAMQNPRLLSILGCVW